MRQPSSHRGRMECNTGVCGCSDTWAFCDARFTLTLEKYNSRCAEHVGLCLRRISGGSAPWPIFVKAEAACRVLNSRECTATFVFLPERCLDTSAADRGETQYNVHLCWRDAFWREAGFRIGGAVGIKLAKQSAASLTAASHTSWEVSLRVYAKRLAVMPLVQKNAVRVFSGFYFGRLHGLQNH